MLDGFALDVVIFLDVGVESVFDLVLGAAGQLLADLGPLTAQQAVELDYLAILFIRPVFLLDFGIQFVYKTFSDLLAGLGAEHLREQLPVFAYFLHHLSDRLVFFRRPDLSVGSILNNPPVAMQTLVLVTVCHQ